MSMRELTVTAAIVLGALGGLCGGGCSTPSINPLATTETATTDAGLIGTWRETKDGDATYLVTEETESSYRLSVVPTDKDAATIEFSLTLVKLGEHRYIDMTVTGPGAKSLEERFGTTALPAHNFMKVKRDGDSLTVWMVKNEWMNEGLKSGEHGLAYCQPRDGTFVISATTAELQAFFTKHAQTPGAFEDAIVFARGTGARKK